MNETRVLDFQNSLEEEGYSKNNHSRIIMANFNRNFMPFLGDASASEPVRWPLDTYLEDEEFRAEYPFSPAVQNEAHGKTIEMEYCVDLDQWKEYDDAFTSSDPSFVSMATDRGKYCQFLPCRESQVRLLHQTCAADHLLLSPCQRFFRSQ